MARGPGPGLPASIKNKPKYFKDHFWYIKGNTDRAELVDTTKKFQA